MTIIGNQQEALDELARVSAEIDRLFALAEGLANEFDIEWSFDMGGSEYRRIDQWEADEFGLVEGEYMWISSSTFC